MQAINRKLIIEKWYGQLFERLGNSRFRSSFHLKQKDIHYINSKGMDTIREHARDFIAKREAPAVIPNDGKQTPMKGHPVFVAQQEYLVDVIMTWIRNELDRYGLI